MKKIIITLLILILLLAVLLVIRNLTQTEFNGLSIKYLGKEFQVKNKQLRNMERQVIWADDKKYDTLPLQEVLQQFPIKLENIQAVTLISKDGGALNLKNEELSDAYLALKKQKNELQLRLILPKDEFKQRWLKRVVEIQVR
ncbi:MAG: hypothetical protein SVM86_04800 [Candidatus Cloacimonadota bacterium]|nr:hypothetical protein [Candidatus Cloacimonadota bacterium]